MYSEITKRSHWFIPKAELRTPVEELRRTFLVRGRFADTEPIATWAETQKHFGVPLYYRDMSRQAERVIDQTAQGSPVEIGFTSDLRPRQQPIHDRFVQSVAQGKHGFMLVAGTGTGKTVMILDMLAHLGRTALVVVPRNYIVKQWRDRILEHTDLKPEDIGVAQQDRCEFEGKKIVVGMIHSLMKDKYPMEFKRWPGVVVYDEAHVLGAKEFNKTIPLFPAAYRIAATATPDRADGTQEAYNMHVNEVELRMQGGTDVTPQVFLRGYQAKKKHPYLHKITDAKNRRGVLLTELAKDSARNALIAVYTKKFVASGRRTLILSDRKEQLNSLHAILTKRHRMEPRKVGMFVAETKEMERKRVLQYCSVILATYGVMSMAVDVPDLRALIFATPQSDVEQPLGRILRLAENVKDPVAMDIVDTMYHDAVRWAKSRQKHYEEAGVKVVHVRS